MTNDDDLAHAIRRSLAHLDHTRPFVAPARRGRRFAMVGVAAAALVAVVSLLVVVVVVRVDGGGSAAADSPRPLEFTPIPLGVEEVVASAAEASLAGSDERPPPGSYRYSIGEAWWVEPEPREGVVVRSVVLENWVGRDGYGRREERPGHDIEAFQVVHDDPPDLSVPASAVHDDVMIVDPSFEVVPDSPGGRVDADDLGIDPFLADRDAAVFERITTLLAAAPLSPTQRAVLWRSLGDLDGVQVRGATTDRHGRAAVALARPSSLGGLESENVILIDIATGTLLGGERIYVGPSSPVDGEPPALSTFVVHVDSAIVDEAGERP